MMYEPSGRGWTHDGRMDASTAGPPSPEKPAMPLPAMVTMHSA